MLTILISQRKGKNQTSTTNQVFHACSVPFHARVHWNWVFFSCKSMKRRHSFAIMFCVLSPLSCVKATACYPSLKTTTTRALIVGFFDLKHMSVNHYLVLLSAADIRYTTSSAGPSPPPPQRGCDKLIFSGQFGPRSGPTKCLMFCSRNKGADKTACAVCRLIFACNKVGVHTFKDVW